MSRPVIGRNLGLFSCSMALFLLSAILIRAGNTGLIFAGGALYITGALVLLKTILNASEGIRDFRRGFGGWGRWAFFGLYAALAIHTFVMSLIFLTGGIKGGDAWKAFFIMEFPLAPLLVFFESLLSIRVLPSETGLPLWTLFFLYGVVAWGVLGASVGVALHFIYGLFAGRRGGY